MILHSNRGGGDKHSAPGRGSACRTKLQRRGYMRKRSLWLLAGLVLVASLIIGPGATASPQKATAGTVVFIHDQEPPNLQGPWVGNNLYATSLVLNNIWYGCQIRDANGALVPRLCVAKPKVVKPSPLTVQFEYKKERGVERRQARRRRGLLGDVAGLHQPEEQRRSAARAGRTSRASPAVTARRSRSSSRRRTPTGSRSSRAARTRRTSSRART